MGSSRPAVSSVNIIMSRWSNIFGVLLAITSIVNSMEISQLLMEEEMEAFKLCESNMMIGLTWLEVAECEAKNGEKNLQEGIPLPTEGDFNRADLNCDGVLF